MIGKCCREGTDEADLMRTMGTMERGKISKYEQSLISPRVGWKLRLIPESTSMSPTCVTKDRLGLM
jgi:hypothetical protein